MIMKTKNLIDNFSIDTLVQFFREKIDAFTPMNEDYSFHLKESHTQFSALTKLGESINNSDSYEDLLIFACRYNGELSERSSKKSQFDIAKSVLKNDFKDGAIFIFYDDAGSFRFSFIKRNYGDEQEKFSNWKRYTYFVSKSETNRTFKERIDNCNFDTLDSILDAFSVEPLNKEFYTKIQTIFYKLIGGELGQGKNKIKYKSVLELPGTEDNNIKKQFGVRLVGRIIFCWFLKYKKSIANISLVPNDWLSTQDSENYYHSKLEILFFEILNKKIENRKSGLSSNHKLIPFLNGGLFEPLNGDDKDYYNGSSNYALKISDSWFEELFEILQQYNFTIDENSINDSEVSIDPEMLGRIFENLLAEIDPNADEASKKSVKKATGSFYTPREIVDYMVEESIVLYLFNNTFIEKSKLKKLFTDDNVKYDNLEINQIIESLSNVKILDPACGSGAFPMGALHKIVIALKKIDPDAILWKKRQLANVKNSVLKIEMNKILNNSNSEYARKIGILQNCIYGVDIQPIATEISKLRCFLSLIVEEEIDDSKDNRGVLALPNLDFKFVSANSLRSLSNDGAIETQIATELIPEFEKVREDYLQSHGDEKEELKKKFQNLAYEIFNSQINFDSSKENRIIQLTSWNPFENKSSSWFDPNWMFGIPQFDIILGNPPYGGTKIDDDIKKSLGIDSKDPYGAFIAKYINSIKTNTSLKDNGILAYIVSDTFMTIKSHFKLRKKIMENTIHKMIRVHPDTFKATVNTAIVLLERNELIKKINDNKILMADFTNISIHDRYTYFYNILQDTQIGLDKINNVSNKDYAIYTYPQNLIDKNTNLPFFVASPKLFKLMQDSGKELETYFKNVKGKDVTVRKIHINEKYIDVVKLDVEKVAKGMDSSINNVYRASEDIPIIRTHYDLVEISEIQNILIRKLSDQEKVSGVNQNNKFIIPFNKGGSSDSKNGWLPNYYVPIEYYINWNKDAVNDHYHRNKLLYFKDGICFSFRGEYSPTFKMKNIGPFDANSSYISCEFYSKNYLLGILCSKLIKYIFKCFIQHTIASDIDKIKEIPINIKIESIELLINNIISSQKIDSRYDYSSHEQIEIDKLVYEAYGLNVEDVKEVEDWFARRYPKLSEAQKKNLRELNKSDDYLELYGFK